MSIESVKDDIFRADQNADFHQGNVDSLNFEISTFFSHIDNLVAQRDEELSQVEMYSDLKISLQNHLIDLMNEQDAFSGEFGSRG